jgi:hypothetical protein
MDMTRDELREACQALEARDNNGGVWPDGRVPAIIESLSLRVAGAQ